jgi:glycosyltransferase involved in cell wall biosynthesis
MEIKKKLSIVTPCFNEELNIELCYSSVKANMDKLSDRYSYEHIFSDNASSDKSLEILRGIASYDSNVKVLVNSRNVGPFRNMASALKFTSGDAVVPMVPADLQDPPEVIEKLIAEWENGFKVVYGVRENRKEGFFLKKARATYYYLLKISGGVTPPANAGEFMLIDRKVVQSITAVDDEYPYLRGLVAQAEPKYSSVSYEWAIRDHGKSRNSIVDLFDQALNGIITTTKIPARLSMIFGLVMSVSGILIGAYNLFNFLFNEANTQQGIPTLIVAVFIFGGLNLFFLGLVGEYVLAIYSQVRKPPEMYHTEKINF